MSDSLRDQMLKAGFKQTAVKKPQPKNAKSNAAKHKSGGKPNQAKRNTTGEPSSMERANIAERAVVAERKRIKGEIKAIIDAAKIENTKGESAHSYLVGKRIKQMFIAEALQKKLVDGELVITRLNGATYLIPSEAGERVKVLNPDWVVITPSSDGSNDIDDEYADFQVPDDLKW